MRIVLSANREITFDYYYYYFRIAIETICTHKFQMAYSFPIRIEKYPEIVTSSSEIGRFKNTKFLFYLFSKTHFF